MAETGESTGNDGKGRKAWIAIGGGALVLVAAGIFGLAALRGPASPAAGADGEAKAADAGPALYTSLHPPLVVNFTDSTGERHFMQVTMELMAREKNVIEAVRTHAPAIRNRLILLYGNTDYEAAITREGKEKMLSDALAEVQAVLRDTIGRDGVEAVYFTNLVIQ